MCVMRFAEALLVCVCVCQIWTVNSDQVRVEGKRERKNEKGAGLHRVWAAF